MQLEILAASVLIRFRVEFKTQTRAAASRARIEPNLATAAAATSFFSAVPVAVTIVATPTLKTTTVVRAAPVSNDKRWAPHATPPRAAPRRAPLAPTPSAPHGRPPPAHGMPWSRWHGRRPWSRWRPHASGTPPEACPWAPRVSAEPPQ